MAESIYLFECGLGRFLLTFNDGVLTRLVVADESIDAPLLQDSSDAAAREVCQWLLSYFEGGQPQANELRFNAQGTSFQQRVWTLLADIPYGYCVTYGFLAQLLAPSTRKRRLLARAVGQALSRNPIWIVIPCHRVVTTDGLPGGYAGGQKLKIALLRHEGVKLPEQMTCII